MDKVLIYVVIGMLIVDVAQPIIAQITSVICSALEALKGKFTYKVQKINADIEKIEYPEDVEYPMGFQVPTDDDYYDYDDDEEEDKKHNHIGF